MRVLVCLLPVVLVFAACETRQEPQTREAVERVVLAQERQANDQWSAGHPSGFSVHFADDVTWFDDIAAQDRVEGLEQVQAYFDSLEGKVPPHTYEMVDPKVQLYGDVAILTYQYHPTFPGDESSSPWKATSVYHLEDGEWKVVHANWSSVEKGTELSAADASEPPSE